MAEYRDIPKIFVITLSGAKERQKNISTQLETMGIPFEFIYGIEGKQLSKEEMESVFDAEKSVTYYMKRLHWKKDMTPGEIGCALSHRLAYKKIIEHKITRAIILEDDIIIKNDFQVVMILLNRLKINNYVIKFDYTDTECFVLPWHKKRLNDEYSIQHWLYSGFSTLGYYIDIKAANIMYTLTGKIFCAADEWEFAFKDHIKLRNLNKAIVTVNDSIESVIGERLIEKIVIRRSEKLVNKIKMAIRLISTILH
jgi:glycosyl transferase family 25